MARLSNVFRPTNEQIKGLSQTPGGLRALEATLAKSPSSRIVAGKIRQAAAAGTLNMAAVGGSKLPLPLILGAAGVAAWYFFFRSKKRRRR